MRHRFELDGVPHDISLVRDGAAWRLGALGTEAAAVLDIGTVGQGGPAGQGRLTLDGAAQEVWVVVEGDVVHVQLDGRAYALRYRDPVALHAEAAAGDGNAVAHAPMPGVVLALAVAPGDPVRLGDALLTIESMKMETVIKATRDGVVEAVHVRAGQTFDRNAPLVTLREGEG